jgi:hypothetical protein
MKHAIVAALAVALGVGGAGCDDKKAPTLAPVASGPASSAAVPSAKSVRFSIDPKSATSIDLAAPREHIKARTDGAAGTLDIDVTNLKSTRGEVKVDLTTLSTRTFDDAKKDAEQTAHARTWLEVADGDKGKVPEDVKAANRYAVFSLRSVENLSATDLSKVPSTKDGVEEVRTVTATARGELFIHGHKVDREAEVEVQFRYAPGSAPDRPKSVAIRSKSPLKAVLADHEVKPRDGFGKLAKDAFNLIGTKVADVAEVSLDLRATPQS